MDCVFCTIIAGESPATFYRHEDEFVIIKNKLTWVPVMLLGMPTIHLSQQELWQSPVLPKIGKALSELGEEIAPGGFRVLSNFGRDGMQSQSHGHVHLIGGLHLGPYA